MGDKISAMCLYVCPFGCQCFIINCQPIGYLDSYIDSDWLSSPWVSLIALSGCLSLAVFVIHLACLTSMLQADWPL